MSPAPDDRKLDLEDIIERGQARFRRKAEPTKDFDFRDLDWGGVSLTIGILIGLAFGLIGGTFL